MVVISRDLELKLYFAWHEWASTLHLLLLLGQGTVTVARRRIVTPIPFNGLSGKGSVPVFKSKSSSSLQALLPFFCSWSIREDTIGSDVAGFLKAAFVLVSFPLWPVSWRFNFFGAFFDFLVKSTRAVSADCCRLLLYSFVVAFWMRCSIFLIFLDLMFFWF